MLQEIPVPPIPPPPPPINAAKGLVPATRTTFEPVKLHFAINRGDFNEAKKEVDRRINIDYMIHGYTPLLLAIVKEHYDIAIMLIKSGADVNKRDKFKLERQAIHIACKMGALSVVECLVKHGASVHSCDNDGNTPLNISAYEGHSDLVHFLCERGGHLSVKDGRGKTPLFNAVENNHTETVDILLEEGGFSSINTHDRLGWTPLMHCIVCGYLDLTKGLIHKGANIEVLDRNGEIALHFACGRLKGDHLKCLCENNINFDTRHLKVVTPIIIRALGSKVTGCDFVDLLIDCGCDINTLSGFGQTPLGIAMEQKNYDVVELLVRAGCDVHTYNEDWITTLDTDSNSINNPSYLGPLAEDVEILDMLRRQLDVGVRTLAELCRLAIRGVLGRVCSSIREGIPQLPLPPKINDFLQV